MDVGKEREQERKLFRQSERRKRSPWLSPGELIPAYICLQSRQSLHSGLKQKLKSYISVLIFKSLCSLCPPWFTNQSAL
jgi:hypothetical protein